MGFGDYKLKTNIEEIVAVPVLLTGAGAADPVKSLGRGVTVTRQAAGQLRHVFKEHIGDFLGVTQGFGQNAPAAGGGVVVTYDANQYTAAGKTVDVFVEDPGTEAVAPALADLAATDKLLLIFWFQAGGNPT